MTTNVSGPARARITRDLAFTLVAVLLVLVTPREALAQTTSTWSGGTGNWAPCPQDQGTALWDTCSADYYPGKGDNSDTAIVQGGPVTIGSGEGITIANLSIAAGDSVIVTPGYLDFTGSSIVNNGSLVIGAGNGVFIQAPANITLSGSGSVTITDPNTRLWGGNGTGATLNNLETIQGQGGLGVGGLTINNSGTISANVSGGTLAVQPVAMNNAGTIQAASGGTLDLIGAITFNNSGGTIQALDKSTVLLQTNISGGTITTSGSGSFTLAPPGAGAGLITLTNAGTFNVPAGASLNWTGTITNTGVFQLPGTISTNGTVTLKGSGSAVMSGGGFDGVNANPLVNQQLIHGYGTIYEVPLTNQATIQADNTSSALYIDGSTTTNTGTLQASGGGTLQLETVVNNSGGTILAQNGSTVIITNDFNGSINGGTLTTSGSGVIQSQNGLLDGTVNIPTNAGTLSASGGFDLFLQGTINNTGTITLNDNSCFVLNAATTLTGSGSVVMGPNACVTGSGIPFTNESTIEGAGSIGDSNPMPITNTGTIIANQSSPLIIQPNSTGFTNTGTLISNAGSTLNVHGTLTNLVKGTLTGGTYNAAGIIDLQASIVTNNSNLTLNGPGAQIYDAFDGVNALAGLTTNGKGTLILENGASLTTTTNLSNKGTLTIGPGSSLATGGSFTATSKVVTVDGILTAPTSLNVKKGTVQGKGTLAGSVTSTGIVIAGDSTTNPGVFTINGSYTQDATGSLDVAINGTQVGTQYSQLAVSNGVSLNGVLSIKISKKFVPALGTNFTILTASVVSGQFSTVKGASINSNEHFEVNYNSGSVVLTVASGP
jgi:hypothetical protein